MMKRFAVILLAAAMLLGAVQAADAVLQAVDPGPYLAGYGFYPAWYQDTTGQTLELCLSTTVSPNVPGSPMCLLSAPLTVDPVTGALLDPAAPIVFPDNFGDENFWFTADALIDNAQGFRMLLVNAVEAAFGGAGDVVNGQQISFARVRIRIDVPPPGGVYTVTTPYGTFRCGEACVLAGSPDPVPAAPGVRTINFTEDIGIGAPGVFTGALTGKIGPFLQAANAPGGTPTPTVIGTETFIGDPNIDQFVTGSPFGNNFFRVEGPGIGALTPTPPAFLCPGIANCIQTNVFAVSGKVFNNVLPTSVLVDRSTYSRSAAGSHIDVFATSTPTATLSFRDTLTASTSTSMLGDGSGKFYGQEANPASIPTFVYVTATDARTNPATLASPVVDVLKITKAQYALDTRTLRIEATSSDQASPPTLTAIGFGELSAGTLNLSPVAQPPARVTVVSSQGGRDTEPVQIVPSLTTPPAPAATTTTITAPAVTFPANGVVTVTVSSAAGTPSGNVSLSVDGVAAGTQALDTAGSTTFTLTSPAVGTHSLSASYAGDGTFAPSSATGSLVVNPAATAETITATATVKVSPANRTTPATASWTINGTTSVLTPHTMSVTLDRTGQQIDGAATTDTRGRWKMTANKSTIIPQAGDTITVTSNLGTVLTGVPVTIR